MKNKNQIAERVNSLTPKALKSIKIRTVKNDKLEKAVLIFFDNSRQNNIPISGCLMKQKGLLYAKIMGIINYSASDGWLTKFKRRNSISFKQICGERKSVNMDLVNDWKQNVLNSIIQGYTDENIFNADEFALYYECMPDKTFKFTNTICFGTKANKIYCDKQLIIEEGHRQIIQKLWDDAGVQSCYERRREYHLNDSCKYYLSALDRLCTDNYTPSTQDILRARTGTTWILEYNFNVKGMNCTMVDVGKQRSERRK
ncbi:hypothetical protein A3Q56_00347 [Intoshia linei]|uniref:HTH CENPB-type domain-containing protein n=1 Tax=Intoshia linei TaxID=1819745 RepID=A0A177BC31_9BILA|nr:hypothetical protein A3Q56_00347 [Intoshia linei]